MAFFLAEETLHIRRVCCSFLWLVLALSFAFLFAFVFALLFTLAFAFVLTFAFHERVDFHLAWCRSRPLCPIVCTLDASLSIHF